MIIFDGVKISKNNKKINKNWARLSEELFIFLNFHLITVVQNALLRLINKSFSANLN